MIFVTTKAPRCKALGGFSLEYRGIVCLADSDGVWDQGWSVPRLIALLYRRLDLEDCEERVNRDR